MRRRSNVMVLLGIAFFLVGGAIVYLVTRGEDGGPSGPTELAAPASQHADPAAAPPRPVEIPPGHEGLAVQIDFVAGGAGYVTPGDRINLYGVFADGLGDAPAESVRLLLPAVEVLDVDLAVPPRAATPAATDDPTTIGPTRASATSVTYLLAVRPEDAPSLVGVTEFERLYASLVRDSGQAG